MKPSLRNSLFSKITALSLASLACVSFALVYMEYHYFRKDVGRIRRAHLSSQKQLIRSEVDRAVKYIRYMKSRTESRLQASIKSRVYEAHTIATHLFNRFEGTMTRNQLAALIKDTLRPIRFSGGRGYFFIADMENRIVLLPLDPKIEGMNLSDRQDQDGTYVFRTASHIVRQSEEGFFEYRWPKPGVAKGQFRKISFVKGFRPMGWYIGTGEYIDDVEIDIQAEVVARLEKIRFGHDGYIFAGRWDGRTLIGPGKGQNMLDVTDVNGVRVVRRLIAAARQGGGFVEYMQPPFPGWRHTEKISFAAAVPEWQWYVGAGVYVDTIEDRIAGLKRELDQRLCWHVFLYSLLFMGLAIGTFLVAHKLSVQMDTVIKSFLDFFEATRNATARIDPESQPYAEFAQLAAAANEMAEGRETAEAALRRSEERYREIVEGTDNLVTEVDTEGRFTFVNEASRKVFGMEPSQCIGRLAFDFIHPEDREKTVNHFSRWIDAKTPGVTFENRQIDGSGRSRDMLWSINFHYNAAGEINSIKSIARDITDRKRAEEELSRYRYRLEELVEKRAAALRRTNDQLQAEIAERRRVAEALRDSEKRLAEIFDFLPDATFVVNRQGRVQLWNRSIEEMTGIKAADILGKGDYQYAIPFYGERRPILVNLAMAPNRSFEKEYLRFKKVGDRLVGEAHTPNLGSGGVFTWGSARPLYGASGEVVGAIESVRDITDQKQTEAALKQYADTQTVLVREVNHRVKNNLSAIIGMLHMEQDRAEAEGRSSYLPVLKDLVWRIKGLSTVHSLLSASGWRPLEVDELCRQVVNAALQGVPLGKRIDVEISPDRVRINSNQAHHLTLVINELTTNTVKYALADRERACITIAIDPHDHTLEIRFRDDGPGFPAPILNKDTAPASIGFELIRGIVRQSLGGEVTFENHEGAVVQIRFPNELEAGGGTS